MDFKLERHSPPVSHDITHDNTDYEEAMRAVPDEDGWTPYRPATTANADFWRDYRSTTALPVEASAPTDRPSSLRRDEESHGSLSAAVAFGLADSVFDPECALPALPRPDILHVESLSLESIQAAEDDSREETAYLERLHKRALSRKWKLENRALAESYYSGPRIYGQRRLNDDESFYEDGCDPDDNNVPW